MNPPRKQHQPNLADYHAKRDFEKSPEPRGNKPSSKTGRLFAVQKHSASSLHYDLRLELDGVLLSWAVPKGPSLDPTTKPLAVRTENHPIEYADFEGVIPKGEYGGGTVMLWDIGEWEPINEPHAALKKGDLKFRVYAEKLGGEFALVRMKSDDPRNWLLIKKKDDHARPRSQHNVLTAQPNSVATGRTIEQIAADADAVWSKDESKRAKPTTRAPRRTGRLDPSAIQGARKAPQPTTFKPQLCETAPAAPEGDDWIHEIKHDGYRLIVLLENGVPKLLTRNAHDWTDRFPNLLEPLASLPVPNLILDAEVVVLDPAAVADFGALQSAFRRGDRAGFVLYLFDAMHAAGFDLTSAPLLERKAYLQRLILATPGAAPTLRYSDHIRGKGPTVAAEAAAAGLEGIISKRADSKYIQRRSPAWLKVKFLKREDFIIVGHTAPEGARTGFGALLVARYDDDNLIYTGRVGTGFSQQQLTDLPSIFKPLTRPEPPVANPPTGADAKGVTWLEPRLVAEIKYAAWTHEGMLRHPAFVAMREDKNPKDVTGRAPKPTPRQQKTSTPPPVVRLSSNPGDRSIGGVRISNPDRIVYPETGHTKGDVAEYLHNAAHWILPFIADRPLSLVRCPEGVEREHFFQKHVGEGFPPSIHGTPIAERGAKHPFVYIRNATGLLNLAQMGVLEIHAWGARRDKPESPDWIVLDLDPGPGIEWEHVVESARFIRNRLADLDLISFPKTTGGAGIHVVVPITRRAPWDDIKTFAHAFARHCVTLAPQNFVATITKSRREHRIFIDYLRNAQGATAVAPYSPRARPFATVSTPLRWSELSPKLTPRDLDITSVARRLARLKSDPWEGFHTTRQSITKPIRRALSLD